MLDSYLVEFICRRRYLNRHECDPFLAFLEHVKNIYNVDKSKIVLESRILKDKTNMPSSSMPITQSVQLLDWDDDDDDFQ